jgi:hypothetical protein
LHENDKCKKFLYSNKVDSYTLNIVEIAFQENTTHFKYAVSLDTTSAERIIFDSTERSFIRKEIKLLSTFEWADKLFQNSQVIDVLKIDSIQHSIKDNKLDTIFRFCFTIYTFSKPIFLRNNTVCIFYVGKVNFAIKEGEFWIYKKIKSKWIKFSPVYRWVE